MSVSGVPDVCGGGFWSARASQRQKRLKPVKLPILSKKTVSRGLLARNSAYPGAVARFATWTLAPVEQIPPPRDLVGRRPRFPRNGRWPRGLAAPGSAPRQRRDVAEGGCFIPPRRQKRHESAAASPPIAGDFGGFRAFGGAFRGLAAPEGASPATARVCALAKVYI